MHQTRAKLNWYKITWKWHRNTSIGDLLKDSYFGSHKGNVKTVIGNSSNPSSHGERAKAARFYFATIKNNNFIKWCRRVIILMARIWIKRRLSIQKKIHGCSENSVSEEALFTVLDVKYIISLNISAHSAKPTFICRKSKGNSYSQTCMILRIGQHSKLVRATFVLYMITKRLPSYNCCETTITNFNLFVLSCT